MECSRNPVGLQGMRQCNYGKHAKRLGLNEVINF